MAEQSPPVVPPPPVPPAGTTAPAPDAKPISVSALNEAPSELDQLLGEAPPVSQEPTSFRKGWASWLRQMPRLSFPQPNEQFELIDRKQLIALLKDMRADQDSARRIVADLKHLDVELLRMFRERDYEAKYQQNRYRLYQITYILLAALATLLGSLLALFLEVRPALVPYIALGETFVALATTYLATISGREPAMPAWLDNRRRAEHLRREYFRYLANIEPYDEVEGYEREMLLARRAADINRGFFPGLNPDEGK
ncbi:MAG: DUF4231 domain-containing protein [bacterium]|nr:DUF4231 domain-containing protein [bacterium]